MKERERERRRTGRQQVIGLAFEIKQMIQMKLHIYPFLLFLLVNAI
jgi:hypothetical protein